MGRGLTVLLLHTLLVQGLAAQSVGGLLSGRVTDSAGAGLSDVHIDVAGPHLQGSRTAVTSAEGRFLVRGLPVGRYRVQARRVGFQSVTIQDVAVRLGDEVQLTRIVLRPAALVTLDELIVTAEAAGLSTTGAGLRSVFDAGQLAALPLPRNLRDMSLLAVGASPSFLGDGVNIGGGTGLENNYFVDGINMTSPINGAGGIELPYNFVQQMEVRTGGTAPHSEESIGGLINVVTPGGSNHFTARVFAFHSSDALQATPRSVAGASQTGFGLSDAGLVLAGPLRRDRLWFHAALGRVVERREHSFAFGRLEDRRTQLLYAGKLIWSTDDRGRVTLTLLGDPLRRDGVQPPPLAAGEPQNSGVVATRHRAGSSAWSLRLERALGRALLLEARLSRLSRTETEDPRSAAGRTATLVDFENGTLGGGHGMSTRFEGRRATGSLDLALSRGAHAARTGVEYQAIRVNVMIDALRTGTGGIVQRFNDSTWSWFEGDAAGSLRNSYWSAYLQDSWQVSHWLRLDGGLRWSRQDLVRADDDSLVHRLADGVQPRVSLVVTPGSGSWRAYATWARIADQFAPFNAQFYGPSTNCLTNYRQDPRVDTTGAVPGFCFRGVFAPQGEAELRGLLSDEVTIGFARRLGRGGIEARLVRRSLVSVVEDGFDAGGTLRLGNPGRGLLADFPRATRRYLALELSADHAFVAGHWLRLSYVLSSLRGNYTGLYATDLRVPAPHAGPQFDFAEQLVNGSGWLPNDRRHVVSLIGAARLARGLSVGATLFVASGTPRSEYGGISVGAPYWGFPTGRGSAGRSPAIADLSARVRWDTPLRGAARWRLLADVQHILSARAAVDYDQLRYTCAANDATCLNPNYGAVTQYQPPMTARLGLEADFE